MSAVSQAASRGPYAKNWCFTLNNYEHLLDGDTFPSLTYMVYQEELGESGTPHLQGYMQFSVKQRLTTLLKIDDLTGAHFEVAKGSLAQNEEYCTKDEGRIGGPYHWGAPQSAGQGQRTDLLALTQLIDSGKRFRELIEDQGTRAPCLRFHKYLRLYKRLITERRDWLMNVFLFVGTPGTGKSRTAHILAGMLGKYYCVPPSKGSGLYWDDYDGETTVIIDEMDGNRMSATFFNQLCDRYPLEVPVHGGAGHQFCSQNIIICSNFLPKYWWKKGICNIEAVERRITATIPFIPPIKKKTYSLNGVSQLLANLVSV